MLMVYNVAFAVYLYYNKHDEIARHAKIDIGYQHYNVNKKSNIT